MALGLPCVSDQLASRGPEGPAYLEDYLHYQFLKG